jgi:hypothetical protein
VAPGDAYRSVGAAPFDLNQIEKSAMQPTATRCHDPEKEFISTEPLWRLEIHSNIPTACLYTELENVYSGVAGRAESGCSDEEQKNCAL